MKFFKKIKSDNGNYIDKDGHKFFIEWCDAIYAPNNKNPEDLNYYQFDSQEDALNYWELSPYIDPELEKFINEQNLITEND